MSDVKHEYHYDEVTGLFTRKDTQDVDPIIAQNTAERNSGENDKRGSVGRKFASVPVTVLVDLKERLGIDYMLFGTCPDTTVRMLAWFKDRDNQKFRTSEANLGNVDRFLQ